MAGRIQSVQRHPRAPRHNHTTLFRGMPRLFLHRSFVVQILRRSPTDRNTLLDYTAYRSVKSIHLAITSILALILSFMIVPAKAQTEVVLVSNWSQSVNATSMVDDERLQTFTTGSHAEGYILTRIELDFVLKTTTDSFTVHLWTASGNRPGNRIAILETSEVAVGEPTVFKSSSPVVLEPDTLYFLHVTVKNPNDVLILKATKSGAEDRSRESTSWQIADDSIHIPTFGSTEWITEASVMKIRIFGYGRGIAQAGSR